MTRPQLSAIVLAIVTAPFWACSTTGGWMAAPVAGRPTAPAAAGGNPADPGIGQGAAQGQVQGAVEKYRGLTTAEETQVDALIASDAAAFGSRLKALGESPTKRTLLVLTHLLLAVPWSEAWSPGGDDRAERKSRVEAVLDRLIGDSELESVSARYFRSHAPDDFPEAGSTREAGALLLSWVMERLAKFVWDDERGQFRTPRRRGRGRGRDD